jgi:hypothetical protein
MRTVLALGVVVGLLASAAAAQEAAVPAAERGAAAFAARDWAATAAAYQEVVAADPGSAVAHYRLGAALAYLDRADEAIAHLEKAAQLGWPPVQVTFRLACAQALAGRRDEALRQLAQAVAAGFPARSLLESEPALATLRDDPRFAAALAGADRNAAPCAHDPRFRAFDYWIGEWDVRPNGAPTSTPPSENIVTLEHGQCVIHEHWKAASGGSGESFNVFDASRDEWFQTWVDAVGGFHEYHGNPDAAGNLVFSGDIVSRPGGPRVRTRLSFIRMGPDTVRQLSERTTDGGATWQTNYDLVYTRRTPQRQ